MLGWRPVVSVGLALLIVGGVAYYGRMQPPVQPAPTIVRTGDATIVVEVADSDPERVLGLSGRESLPEGSGLLFDFETKGEWGIWMKDMHFAIDIVWANPGEVVTVAHDVSPSTYPQVFTPAQPVRYVLELPAGYAAAHGIAEGGDFRVE